MLQENRPDAASSLQERRVTRAMTRAAEQAEGEKETGQVGEVRKGISGYDKFGIPIPLPGFRLPGHFISKRRKLKRLTTERRNKILTGDPGFAYDNVSYSVPWKPTQPPILENEQEIDNDNNDNSDSESDVEDANIQENVDTEGEGFHTAAEDDPLEDTSTEEESPEKTVIVRTPPTARSILTLPPPPGATPWRGQTPKAPSTTPPGAWGSSWRPNFFSGQGRLLETFRTVPHPPGSRPRAPIFGQLPFQPPPRPAGSGPGAQGGQQLIRPARLRRTPPAKEDEPRRSTREKKAPQRLDL